MNCIGLTVAPRTGAAPRVLPRRAVMRKRTPRIALRAREALKRESFMVAKRRMRVCALLVSSAGSLKWLVNPPKEQKPDKLNNNLALYLHPKVILPNSHGGSPAKPP